MVSDQFSSQQIEFKKSFMLCAPATKEGAESTTTSTTSTTIVCTQDVKQCPDGSIVVRDPLNGCQFERCPGACDVDQDRRVYSSFCVETGCQCLATGVVDPDPTCENGTVICLIDPCTGMPSTPVCNAGVCEAVPN